MCGVQHAALAATSIGVVQQAELAARISMPPSSIFHAARSGGVQLGERTNMHCQGVSCNRSMEQCALRNVTNCLNTNIYSSLQTSSGQSTNLYSNVVNFFNTSVN
jgi:hypothetical protein